MTPRPGSLFIWLTLFFVIALSGQFLSTLRGADCNGNSIDDLDDLSSAFSEDCNANDIPDECEGPLLTFESSLTLTHSGATQDATVADFNGDGLPDLATGFRGGLSLRLSRLGQEFADYDEVQFGFDGPSRRPWEAGDVDGDDDIDLVTRDFERVLVYLNDGDGGFSEAVLGPEVGRMDAVVVSDLNGDDLADVVGAMSNDDRLLVFLSIGDGQLSQPEEYAVGDNLAQVAVGNADGANGADLFVLNRAAATVSILTNDGEGGFTVGAPLVVADQLSNTFAVADIDADGLDDFVVGTATGVFVYYNAGGGAFADGSPLVTDSQFVRTLTIGDADADGDVDVIVLFNVPVDDFQVFVNTGDRGFLRGQSINVVGGTTSMLLEDLSGDGVDDLVLLSFVSSDVFVVWNMQSEGRLPLQPAQIVDALGEPHTLDIGDLDGDGDFDAVTGNNFDTTITIYMNRGDGTFDTRLQAGFQSFSLTLSDLDGDGDLDLASVDQEFLLHVLKNDGAGNFGESAVYPAGANAFHVFAADVDGDGRNDILTANSGEATIGLLVNRGDATFEESRRLRVGAEPRAVAAADLDGDGDLELIAASEGSGSVSLLYNLGELTFEPLIQFPLPSAPLFVVPGDFDSDGFIDLATANQNDTVNILWNVGDGSGVLDAFSTIRAGVVPYGLTAGDLNDDGHVDLIVTSEAEGLDGNSSIMVHLNNGVVTEEARADPFKVPLRLRAGLGARYVSIGPIDADEDVDVVIANRLSRTLIVYFSEVGESVGVTHLEEICTPAEYFSVSLPSSRQGSTRRVGKYVAPARDDESLLPTLFQNTNRFQLHEVFLGTVFSERFPDIEANPAQYDALVGRRTTRDYYVGTLDLRTGPDGDSLYTFNAVADTGFDPREVLTQEEVGELYTRLSKSFFLRPLAYSPADRLAVDAAEAWIEPDFPVLFDDAPPTFPYEAYTLAVGYGRVRRLTLSQFNLVNSAGRLTFQDVVVIDEAPADIEGVVGGVITGTIQGELSHLAIRTARRGTPNAFVADAHERLAEYDGQLVRLEVFPGEFFVTPVELAEAEEFWENNRREFSTPPVIDEEFAGLDNLLEIDLDAMGSRPESRYGGKASNMARMQRVLTGEFAQYRESGFAIPISYYLEFMRTNFVDVDGRMLTYEEWLFELLSSPEVLGDSQARFNALNTFREFVRDNGQLNGDLVAALAQRIEEEFGDTVTMVRFRSSSNVEDALEFNGAGLYESTSVCVEDTLDPADRDGSYCDPRRDNERTIVRALKKVWASLWTFRAHEERTFYQLDPPDAAMGILVTRAFLDEAANGVAFTGDSRDSSNKDYVVTAQVGEESVVSPRPGTTVERNELEMVDGEVVEIRRARASSLVPAGEVVISDEKLRELGRVMWHVEQNLTLDLEGHEPEEVILDFEFKVTPDDRIAVKQVRPFLIPKALLETPEFEFEVPPRTTVCGMFSTVRVNREPLVEYQTKSVVRFNGGVYRMPTDEGTFAAALVSEVRFGPSQEIAEPVSEGVFTVDPLPGPNGTKYRFTFEQDFALADERILSLQIAQLDFLGRGSQPVDERRVLDESIITHEFVMIGSIDGNPQVDYSSCTYRELPRWEIAIDLEGGSRIDLTERFLPSENLAATGPAALVAATMVLEGRRQATSDYWRLVYAARRHNLNVRYWIVLDPPVELAGLPRTVHAVEVEAPEPPIGLGFDPSETRVRYLDESFTEIAEAVVSGFLKEESDMAPGELFIRGDVDLDATLTISDAVSFLGYAFGSAEGLACQKAADMNDDGRLTIRDAVVLLQHLFQGGAALPEPAIVCGADPTVDELSCLHHAPCD